jgi:hypothetical protein
MRIPDDEWEAYGEAAERVKLDRTKVTREFIRWFTRQPGARMPKRPAGQETTP